MGRIKQTFESFIEREPMSGCWIWTGMANEAGYGRYRPDGRKKVFAHRAAFEMHKGAIPDGAMVCHVCDNPACVNPDHLYLGSAADNMRDKVARGRSRNQNSVKTHCIRGHKLTPENTYGDKRWGSRGGCRLCRIDRYRVLGK